MTDSFSGLKAEVEEFLRDREAARLTSDLMIQIVKVITAMKVFKAGVVSPQSS